MQRDDLDLLAICKHAACGIDVLGRDAQMGIGEHVPPLGIARDTQAAFPHFEIEHLIQIAPLFNEGILSDDAKVCDARLHIDGDVGGLDEEKAIFPVRALEDEFARIF